jgi:hypothetical protein
MLRWAAATAAAAWATCTELALGCQLSVESKALLARAGLFCFGAECSAWNTLQFIMYVCICMLVDDK